MTRTVYTTLPSFICGWHKTCFIYDTMAGLSDHHVQMLNRDLGDFLAVMLSKKIRGNDGPNIKSIRDKPAGAITAGLLFRGPFRLGIASKPAALNFPLEILPRCSFNLNLRRMPLHYTINKRITNIPLLVRAQLGRVSYMQSCLLKCLISSGWLLVMAITPKIFLC